MTEKRKSSEKPRGKEDRPNAVYKLTGTAVKMGVVIWLGIYLGQRADARTPYEVPWFTLAGALVGVALAVYFVIKDVYSL